MKRLSSVIPLNEHFHAIIQQKSDKIVFIAELLYMNFNSCKVVVEVIMYIKFISIFLGLCLSLSMYAKDIQREIAVELYKAKPLITAEDGMNKLNELLVKNFELSKSLINRINQENSARFSKMHDYEIKIGKYKSVILEEALSRSPNEKKIEILYAELEHVQSLKTAMWVKIKKSMWDILKIRNTSNHFNDEYREPMSALRW